jgi:acylphosphatase
MRCFISGTVQGVWYRASAKKEADNLEIKGWARNLDDGRVEVLACGENKNLELFYNWLKKGPPSAQVEEVTQEQLSWKEYEEFDTF